MNVNWDNGSNARDLIVLFARIAFPGSRMMIIVVPEVATIAIHGVPTTTTSDMGMCKARNLNLLVPMAPYSTCAIATENGCLIGNPTCRTRRETLDRRLGVADCEQKGWEIDFADIELRSKP